MPLPCIAHLGTNQPLDRRIVRPRRFEFCLGVAAHAVVRARHLRPVDVFHQAGLRPGAIHARGRSQQPQARTRASGDGGEHRRYLQLARNLHHVHRPCTTGGHHRKRARIVALLSNVDARSRRHVFIDDVANAPRHIGHRELEFVCEFTQRGFGQITPQLHFTTEKVVGIEIAQHQIGIGDGGFGAALPVTRRAGISARALRADVQQAQIIHMRDRAATGTNLDEVDARYQYRQPRAALETRHPSTFKTVRHQRLAAHRNTGLGGGAAHIKREYLVDAAVARGIECRQHAARRTRFQQQNRRLGRCLA